MVGWLTDRKYMNKQMNEEVYNQRHYLHVIVEEQRCNTETQTEQNVGFLHWEYEVWCHVHDTEMSLNHATVPFQIVRSFSTLHPDSEFTDAIAETPSFQSIFFPILLEVRFNAKIKWAPSYPEKET